MSFRHALQAYIDNPSHSSVVFKTAEFIVIRDAYPKALRHFLVLPRDAKVTRVHPLEALQDAQFHAEISLVVEQAKNKIIDELVSEGLVRDNESERAQFRRTFIKAGVHSTPSMANLHVHVITQDFNLPLMKNKKHYNSFTTLFFVDLESLGQTAPTCASDSDLESSEDFDVSVPGSLSVIRKPPARNKAAKSKLLPHRPPLILRDAPLVCTDCGRLYGNRFAELKKHLSAEFSTKFCV